MIAITRQLFDSRVALPVAGWLLVLACALFVLRIGWLLVDGVTVEFDPIEFEPARDPAAVAPGPTDWRMFGEPVETDYGFDRPMPRTPLALRLRGVVTGERGYAIIVDADGDEGVYRVDDRVTGEAKLIAIEQRRVVLERNGTRETLALPAGAEPAESSLEAGQRAATEAGMQPETAAGTGIGSLKALASQFTVDPAELANRITILPVSGGGFRVRAGRDATIFTQLGFHANDVVLAINGRPVDNRADVRAVFESYRPGEPLAITVRRGDRQLVLTPDLTNLEGVRP